MWRRRPGVWGTQDADFYEPNVVGTQNVIAACRRAGVGRLVFTSSPSVVFTGAVMRAGIILRRRAPYPPGGIWRTIRRPESDGGAAGVGGRIRSGNLATVALHGRI